MMSWETSERGIWALKISLLGLGATALFQAVIVYFSGSTALLADTIHNVGDAATAIPLWIAFALQRRVSSRRFTYGYGRTEDIAGVIIVGLIFVSACVAGYELIRKLIDPQPITHLGWVAAAAIVGFVGNEAVAVFRIRVGTQSGSAALIADGQHSPRRRVYLTRRAHWGSRGLARRAGPRSPHRSGDHHGAVLHRQGHAQGVFCRRCSIIDHDVGEVEHARSVSPVFRKCSEVQVVAW